MTLKQFADMQNLTKIQTEVLEGVANKLVKHGIIATPDQLYQSLAADNATLCVQDAAIIAGLSAHTIRILGKQGKFEINGDKKIHRIEYKSFLNYLKTINTN